MDIEPHACSPLHGLDDVKVSDLELLVDSLEVLLGDKDTLLEEGGVDCLAVSLGDDHCVSRAGRIRSVAAS